MRLYSPVGSILVLALQSWGRREGGTWGFFFERAGGRLATPK